MRNFPVLIQGGDWGFPHDRPGALVQSAFRVF